MKAINSLPGYSAELDAFHRAHRPELQGMIDDLEIVGQLRVLDVACGDGAYGNWIAQRLSPGGFVLGADLSKGYLEQASQAADGREAFIAASIEELPLVDESFDVAWCAQSLISLPDPLVVLQEMWRVLRRGGRAVVLENDSLHQLILPWPEELELAIRAAEWRAYCATKRKPQKRYMGRRLSAILRSAGFAQVSRRTYATDRLAPLSRPESTFLQRHLAKLRATVWQWLSPRHRTQLDRLVLPESSHYMLAQNDFEMTWLDVVCVGTK